jgi:hypothetical protein
MSEEGEPKQDCQHQLRLPMSEGGEPKQDSQNQLRLPMSEEGEPKQDSQHQLWLPMSEAGFDINFLTNLSIRASAILILLAPEWTSWSKS